MTRVFRIIGLLFALLSLIPFAIAITLYRSTESFVDRAISTTGTVVEIRESESSDGTSYRPVFEYRDTSGSVHRKVSPIGSGMHAWTVGDTVSLLYDPRNPAKARRSSFWLLWVWPMVSGTIGAFILITAVATGWGLPVLIRLTSTSPPPSQMQRSERMDEQHSEGAQKTADLSPEEKNWALFAHLTALSLFLGVPFGNIIGPLIIWLVKRDTSEFVEDHSRESLNFQISMTIYAIGAGVLSLILIGIPLLIAIGIATVVLVLVAIIRTQEGQLYRYPLTIRFVQKKGVTRQTDR